MSRLCLVFILPCMLLSLAAVAEQSLIKPQIQGEVTFVSGGVGEDEQNAMQALRADYNLHLQLSVKGTGEYVSDVKVSIKDSSGNTLMESVSEGPMLFAKLKPGRYLITADRDGQLIHKMAKIEGTNRTSLSFTWPQEQGD